MTKKLISMMLSVLIAVTAVLPLFCSSVGAVDITGGMMNSIIGDIIENGDGTETVEEILMKIADEFDTRFGLNLPYEARVDLAKAMYEEFIKGELAEKKEETEPAETKPVETKPAETEPVKPAPVPVPEEKSTLLPNLEYTDTFVMSNSDFNNITVTVKNNVLKLSGTLTCDGLERMAFTLKDMKREKQLVDSSFSIASGDKFEYSVNLSNYQGLPSEKILTYYTRTVDSKDGGYWPPFYDFVVLKKIDGQYKIPVTPYIKQNENSLSAYINPYLSINVTQSGAVKQQAYYLCRDFESDYDKAFAIYTWVCQNIAYNKDYTNKKTGLNPTSVNDIFSNKLASNRGMSDILEAFLEAAGIPAIITTFHSQKAEEILSGIAPKYVQYGVEAYVDGRWIVMFPWLDHRIELSDGKRVAYRPRAYYYFDVSMHALSANFSVQSRRTEQTQNIPSDWAIPEVLAANAQWIVPDIIQYNYRDSITRAEFCTLIMQMLRVKHNVNDVKELLAIYAIDYSENFYDTDSVDVNGAYLLGIVNGRGEGTFDPYSTLTRQEAAVMLANTAKFLGLAPSSKMDISDMDDADSWAHESIRTVTGLVSGTGKPVMNGVDLTRFSPKTKYTREQSILTVYRLFMCE